MSSRQERWLLLFLATVAAVLQITLAGRQGLWADEVFSLATATGHSLEHQSATARPELGDFVEPNHPVPAEEFRRYLQHDRTMESPMRVVHAVLLSDTSPPLYYLLLYLWTFLFGTTDLALRLFSTACSLACLPFLAGIARHTGGRGAVIPACLLFALSPLGIYYSTEARMYSLLWLCLLATTWASLVLRRKGGSIAVYASWVIASTAGFLTHYFFVFPFLALLLYLMVQPGKLNRLYLVTSSLLVALLICPWYINLPSSLAGWRITKDWLNWRPWHFNRPFAVLELVLQFFDGRAKYLWAAHRLSNIVALLLFAYVALVLLWRLRGRLFRFGLPLLWSPFIAACAAPVIFDLARHTYTVAVPRYALGALPGAYLLAALGLACMQLRTRTIILALIVLAWTPSLRSIYRQHSRSEEAFREIARAVSVSGDSSSLVLIHSIPSGVLGIARYANASTPIASWVGQLRNRRVPESIRELATGRARILFVKVHEVGEPAPEEDWLRANAVVYQERRINAAKITEFRPRAGATF